MELYETIENSVHDISKEFGISRKKAKAALDLYDGQKDKAQEVLKNTINLLEVKKKKNKLGKRELDHILNTDRDREKYLNKISNKENVVKPFYELTLKNIVVNLLKTWFNIINDIIEIFESKYRGNKNKWWTEYIFYSKKILHILTKKDRLIYVGIMLIIISFFLYFIFVTS
tara:strand:+ start:236 stop:751 length:516 start_codon:yes stop_codon:yes gene_type:complete